MEGRLVDLFDGVAAGDDDGKGANQSVDGDLDGGDLAPRGDDATSVSSFFLKIPFSDMFRLFFRLCRRFLDPPSSVSTWSVFSNTALARLKSCGALPVINTKLISEVGVPRSSSRVALGGCNMINFFDPLEAARQ